MKRCLATLSACAAMITMASMSYATVVGFGQIGGSNATVPANLASNAAADGNGFVVTNGATPNIALTWDPHWDIHTSDRFTALENQTIGGGAWDNEGNTRRIGQLDFGGLVNNDTEERPHTIDFVAAPGHALVLNSFDFAHTNETPGTTVWDLTLTDSSANTVWNQTVTFVDGQVFTITPNFTGAFGASYRLTFDRTSQTYNSDGRHGIDNLSFNEIAVPEPATLALFACGALGLLVNGRRR
jgi:hypothetical protein